MKKIKITESQKAMLEAKAAARLKEDINYSQSGAKAVTDEFKKAGANKVPGVKVESETEEIQMSELAPKVLDFIKQLYTKPSMDSLDPFWASIDVTWDELIQLLTELQLIKSVSGGYRLQKLERVGGPTAVVRIVTKLVQKLINDKRVPMEEDIDLSQDMSGTDMFKGLVEDWLQKFTNNRVEFLYKKGEFKNAWLTIRRIGKEATRRPQLEEDGGYPAGAQHDPAAPYNQVDPPAGRQAENRTLELQLWVDEYAFFTKDGKLFVYNVESADNDEYEEYASREETYLGRDEDGMPDVEYGEWEMDEEIIDNYVNDNIEHLSTGVGLDDWENGADIVEVDPTLAQDLLGIAKYIKNPKTAEAFTQTLSSIAGLEETSTFSVGGQFTPALGKGGNAPITKTNVDTEMNSIIKDEVGDEGSVKDDIISVIKPFANPQASPLYWLSNSNELKGVVDKIRSLGDDEWELMVEFIILTLQSADKYYETKDKKYLTNYLHQLDGLVNFVNHFSVNIEEMDTQSAGNYMYDANALGDSDFMTAGNKLNKKGPANEMVAREGKNAQTDTQWPDGHFVEFDDCTKLNNNKKAQNGGCSTGAVDNVVKTKGSKNSVISDSSIYESIAKETGKTIEEVKSILDRKNDNSK